MASGLRLVVRSNRIGAIIATAPPATDGACQKSALDVEVAWKGLAPVRTGRYRGSITNQQIGPRRWAVFTPLVAPPYPLFLELGTVNMTARPSAQPAAELVRPLHTAAIRDAIKGLL